MQSPQFRFTQTKPFGNLATIEGRVECRGSSLHFELAMTESVDGPVGGVLKRSVALSDLEDIVVRRRWFLKRTVRFTARTLEAFARIPGSQGFEYEVAPVSPQRDVDSFLSEARLSIAQAAMDRFTDELDAGGER